MTPRLHAADPTSLSHAAGSVLSDIRAALVRVLRSLRAHDRGPRDLARLLKIHPTLAWKVLRLAHSRDLFADAQYLPGDVGLRAFLSAAEDRGTPADAVAATLAAVNAFHDLVKSHAGDRTSLEQMLSALSDNARVQSDSRPFRRAGFRCASSTWGMQMRVRLLSKLLHPAADGRSMDIALVRGFVGMRRIRAGAPLPLARVVVLDNDGLARRAPVPEPLDPDGVRAGVPLLRQFCSDPLPEVRVRPGPDGVPEQQLGEAPIGELAAATVFSGEVQRQAASRFQDAHNTVSNTAVSIRAPMELLVMDLWAHRSIFADAAPEAFLYGEACGTPWYKQLPGSADKLPLAESVRTIGPGLARARLSDVPSYVDLMRTTFDRLGWNPDDFILHRLRVEYPVIATAVVLRVPLPAGAP